MHKIFYLLSIIFIWVEIYHIQHKSRIYTKLNKDILKSDILYYIFKVFYIIWILVGTFTPYSKYFMAIFLISLLKFLILFFKSEKLNGIFDVISTILSIYTLFFIFVKCLF